MTDLQSTERAPRNFDEVQGALISMSRKVGLIYGVFLSVGRRGDSLVFVDEGGNEIVDPGGPENAASQILCASHFEIDSGNFLKLFGPRASYAALTVRFNHIDTGASVTS